MSSSCSSAILSQNSRDAILSHNLRNTTCLTLIRATTQGIRSKSQLKEHQQADLRDIPKPCRPHTSKSKQNTHPASALSPGASLESPGEMCFQTAW